MNNDNNSVAIAEAGGITTILSAMTTCPSNAKVQHFGCGVLAFLAAKINNNKVMIAAAGGITSILSAIKTHSSNANVQDHGCAALDNLAENNESNKVAILALNNCDNKVTISDAGGKAVIESAMRNYLSNVGVQEKGNGALCLLTQQ